MRKFLLFLSIVFYGITNAQYSKLHDFANATGALPYGSLLSVGGFLYGMTDVGGKNNVGTIFKIKTDGTGYDTLMSFGGKSGNPEGSLISDGTYLYGMTSKGAGTYDAGNIFKIKPDGTGYTDIFDFTGQNANGETPYGSLYYDGTTYLYGMTSTSGVSTNGYGVIFKIKTDGTGYVQLQDLSSLTTGANPQGSLISDGTYLYGMTRSGGNAGYGTVFKIKTDGTKDTVLFNFNYTNGGNPYGDLISIGNYLYGMTFTGGLNGSGNIFKIKNDGTGFTDLYDFTYFGSGINPYGSLLYDGTFLYGMTYSSGASIYGTLFKIKTDGTGYDTLMSFLGTPNGSGPRGSLISVGGFLYGMTGFGGTGICSGGCGTIFKYGGVAGIEENKEILDFTVYPNPASNNFVIDITANEKQVLQVFDVTGKLMLTQIVQTGKTNIEASKLTNGIYNVCLSNDNGIINKRLVIVR